MTSKTQDKKENEELNFKNTVSLLLKANFFPLVREILRKKILRYVMTWNKIFKLPDESYSILDTQNYFKYIIKKKSYSD